jgi:hypothetical protein
MIHTYLKFRFAVIIFKRITANAAHYAKSKLIEMAQLPRTVKSLTLEINYGTENCQNKSS